MEEEELARVVEALRIVDRVVARYARIPHDREDLSQAIVLDLIQSLRRAQFDEGKSSFPAWVARRAKSRAIDWIRAQNRRRRAMASAASHLTARGLSRRDDGCRRLLFESTSTQRELELLLLRVEDRRTHAEIAHRLGCSASDVGRDLARVGRIAARHL